MDNLNTNDDFIIDLLRQNDKSAIELIYDKYGAALFGVVVKIVKSTAIAEDVLQDAFVKVWKNADKYDNTKGRLFTWLLNITRNTAIDTIRSSKFKQSQKNQPLENSVYNDVRLSTEMQVNHLGLDKVMNTLDEKYRVVLDLIYLQGYTQKEVEDELNIPLGTVKSRVRIALRELRKQLGNSLVTLFVLIIILMN